MDNNRALRQLVQQLHSDYLPVLERFLSGNAHDNAEHLDASCALLQLAHQATQTMQTLLNDDAPDNTVEDLLCAGEKLRDSIEDHEQMLEKASRNRKTGKVSR